MKIGKFASKISDSVPPNHAVIDLGAFCRLEEAPAIVGPSENDIYVCVFKLKKPKEQCVVDLQEQLSKLA
jgi:hypothetical protein